MTSFPGLGSSVGCLRDEYKRLRDVENSKDGLIERLFSQVESLTLRLDESELRAEQQNDLVRLYGKEKGEIRKEKEDIQKAINELRFVVVLVDGDAMPFSDDLVKQKEQGGLDAARLLRQEALQHAQRGCDLLPGTRVLLRVYANLRGLAATYQQSEILQRSDDYLAFQRGFTMQSPLSDYVDVGNGKDRADEKLKELFKMFAADVHCTHILFCASTDNGYARLLEQYTGDSKVCGKTTLVEGPPFEREISHLNSHFHTVKFPSVFRPSKLPCRTTPSPAISPSDAPSGPLPSYATTTSRNLASSNKLTLDIQTPKATGMHRRIMRNRNGERVDPPRPTMVTEQDISIMKKKKLCNWHYLQGGCQYTNCTHSHGEKLDARRTEALRCVARLGPCGKGLGCNDVYCISGHACTRRSCDKVDCRFPQDMHNVDITVAI